jgi:hypothetical protein
MPAWGGVNDHCPCSGFERLAASPPAQAQPLPLLPLLDGKTLESVLDDWNSRLHTATTEEEYTAIADEIDAVSGRLWLYDQLGVRVPNSRNIEPPAQAQEQPDAERDARGWEIIRQAYAIHPHQQLGLPDLARLITAALPPAHGWPPQEQEQETKKEEM